MKYFIYNEHGNTDLFFKTAECWMSKKYVNVIYTYPNKTKCSEEHISETPLYEKVGNFKVNCFSNH